MYYIAVDIGCIECGEESSVIGIFKDKGLAEKACRREQEIQKENWHGEHHFEIFEAKKISRE